MQATEAMARARIIAFAVGDIASGKKNGYFDLASYLQTLCHYTFTN